MRKGVNCNGVESVEVCPTETVPKLAPGNREFWQLFESEILPVFFDSMGGFNFEILPAFFVSFDISRDQQPVLWHKLIAIVNGIKIVQQKEKLKKQAQQQG